MRLHLRLLAALAGSVVVVSGCNSLLGITDLSAPDSPDASADTAAPADDAGVEAEAEAAACAPSRETNLCFKCTDESCCNEYATCAADPRCAMFYKDCLPQCKADGGSFDTCVVQCDSRNGAGHALFAPYNACTSVKCLTECSDIPPDECTVCSFQTCSGPTGACKADRDCTTLTSCITACAERTPGLEKCTTDCVQGRRAETVALYDATLACYRQKCKAACNL